MKAPSPSPLELALKARVNWLATILRPATIAHYRHTARDFTTFLRDRFPAVREPSQLRRDPHVLAWLEQLWGKTVRNTDRPLSKTSRAAQVICLRKLLDLLADHRHPPPPALLLSADIPRPDHTLPRPLSPEHDAALQQELRRRNDVLSNALLLQRGCGMRIGECVDLAADCLRHLGDHCWAIHVPIGKLHSERWTPVDEEIRTIVARLLFLRRLPPGPGSDHFLLPRPKGRLALLKQLRSALCEAAAAVGVPTKVVPHQLRHTYATSMLRAGVSMPALMKLLGHRTANMTLRYVEITQQDLQREFLNARRVPRHLLPLPAALIADDPVTADAHLVIERLTHVIRVLDLFRQHNADGGANTFLLLARRLIRIRALFEKLTGNAGEK
jgi:integrase